MTILLQTHNLTKAFGGLVAVSDVSIAVEGGTTHAVIGPNGAGKTTLFNLLCGNFKPTSGRVVYDGRDITDVPLHRRAHLGIGRSFQIINLFPNLTVHENVRLAAQALGKDNFNIMRRASHIQSYVSRAMEALEIVGLREHAALPASILPHGGKRKLELAILLAADPKLLLLDEPTAGMASEQVPELMQIIDRVRSLGGRTLILVEHNMHVVMNACDRITVMNLGQVLAEGTPREISQNPQVQKVYLGELYDLPGQAAST
jgi:branched-chain amino acid transport system ATP-binding protein